MSSFLKKEALCVCKNKLIMTGNTDILSQSIRLTGTTASAIMILYVDYAAI